MAADPVVPAGDWTAHLVSPIEAARAWSRLRPNHPYAVLRERLDRLEESLRFAASAMPELLVPPMERNGLLPTPLGTVKPSAMGQRNVMGADVASLPEQVALVHFRVNPTFDARLVARGIEDAARALGRTVRVTVVESGFLREVEDALRSPFELGERMDAPAELERLAEELRPRLPSGTEAVLLPPVLGRRVEDLAGRLGELLGGVRCAEVLSASPSLPGIRLQQALDGALTREGVRLDHAEVQCAELKLDAEATFAFAVGEETVRPQAVVLATGKYIGGGIARTERFMETVFDLPVVAGGRKVTDEFIGNLLGEVVVQEHAAFRAGVRVDASLRPLRSDGRPVNPRLFAAGSVICGYDPATDKTGLGVAIFTGYLAGEAAAHEARMREPA